MPLVGNVTKMYEIGAYYIIHSMLLILGSKYSSNLKNSFLTLHQNFDIYVSYL